MTKLLSWKYGVLYPYTQHRNQIARAAYGTDEGALPLPTVRQERWSQITPSNQPYSASRNELPDSPEPSEASPTPPLKLSTVRGLRYRLQAGTWKLASFYWEERILAERPLAPIRMGDASYLVISTLIIMYVVVRKGP